jgi:hypothetical protein
LVPDVEVEGDSEILKKIGGVEEKWTLFEYLAPIPMYGLILL